MKIKKLIKSFLPAVLFLLIPAGFSLADTVQVTKICGYIGSSTSNCSYTSFLSGNTNQTYRGTFSIAVPNTTINSPVLQIATSGDGNFCNTGGCNPVELIQYDSDPGTDWAGQTSYTVIDTQTPTGGTTIADYDMSTAVLTPNTTQYFGFKLETESGSKEAYFGVTDTVMYYTTGSGTGTTSTSTTLSVEQTPSLYFYGFLIFIIALLIGRSL